MDNGEYCVSADQVFFRIGGGFTQIGRAGE